MDIYKLFLVLIYFIMIIQLFLQAEVKIKLGQEDPLVKEMATHSSTLAWEIPWTEEPGRQQLMELQRVRHD